MIRHIKELADDAVIRADVGVVGAGLAGLDLARFLGRRGLRVAVLESGRLEFDAAIQDLARVSFAGKPLRTPETHGHITPYLPPMYRGYCRVRQFGGTTSVWTGKWRMFDPWDFDVRPWIPHSGWPIALTDLRPFYLETAQDYGFGDFDAAAGGRVFQDAVNLLAPHGLTPHLFYWEKSPTRSGTRFFQEVRQEARVDVVLGANATEIVLDERASRVRAIRFASLDRRTFTLCADCFVLAAGGLEVPRLLLASNRQLPAGVGNANGLVGRFFMDHPKHRDRKLAPGPVITHILEGTRTRPRPRFGLSFSLSYDRQSAQSLPNHAVYLRPFDEDARSPRSFGVKIGIEQTPNPQSRVFLGTERDALTMPRLVVDWRFTPADHAAFRTLQRELTAAFRDAGLGQLDFQNSPLTLEQMLDGSHHMGTTRMGADRSKGVVDPDCKVFGTDNLYIASSSVFATAHAYSPSYTILALARRLGHHLLESAVARDGASETA